MVTDWMPEVPFLCGPWGAHDGALESRTGVPGNPPGENVVMIGRLHHVVIDCPEPRSLAAFYSEIFGLPVDL